MAIIGLPVDKADLFTDATRDAELHFRAIVNLFIYNKLGWFNRQSRLHFTEPAAATVLADY